MVVEEKRVVSTRTIEYRIERMPFQEHPEAHLAEMLAHLTELGKQGWRVASVDLTHHPSYSPAAQPTIPVLVLLEKDANMPRNVEYRIERLPFQIHPEAHPSEIIERVAELGKQGWQVASVDLAHHPSYSPAAQPSISLPVLLQRDI